MNSEERKEYMKAWYQAHKESVKAYYQAHKESVKAKRKAYYQAHKESEKAKKKAYHQAHKEQSKAYYQANKEQLKEQMKAYRQAHKEHLNAYSQAYNKTDVNSLGQTKDSIRRKSRYYLNKYGTKIPGYQIHHCCTYDDPYKFISCSKEMHRLIHAYLRQHNIDADSEHYKYIKHLLDDSVVKYNIHD